MKLSIVIPVYFNEENLLPLYMDLKEKVLNQLECEYEIVMVDDGSKDRSYEVILQLQVIDSHVIAVKLSRNFGEHAATLAALSVCTGDCAVRKAADMQEDSAIVLDMLAKYEQGHKVVWARRTDRQEPFFQVLFSKTYTRLMQKLALPNMPDGGVDTFLIDRQVIDYIVNQNESNTPVTEQILWSGFTPGYVDYTRKKREIGKSKWTFSKKLKMAIDSLLGFSYFPVRLMSVIGIISMIGSIGIGIALIIRRLSGFIDVEGYTSIMVLILLSFGIIMFSIGILGEYLWRALDAARNRPPYIIEKITKKEQ